MQEQNPIADQYPIRLGVAGGIVAGIIFTAYAMMMGWLLNGDLFKPLRMMAAITLGENALAHWNSLLAVTLHGIFVMGIFAVVSGIFFNRAISRRRYLASSRPLLLLAGVLYGTLLWITIYYIAAPVFGWLWFPLENNPLVEGFIAHALFFGAVIGLFFSQRLIRLD
jgi:hypothetical protein